MPISNKIACMMNMFTSKHGQHFIYTDTLTRTLFNGKESEPNDNSDLQYIVTSNAIGVSVGIVLMTFFSHSIFSAFAFRFFFFFYLGKHLTLFAIAHSLNEKMLAIYFCDLVILSSHTTFTIHHTKLFFKYLIYPLRIFIWFHLDGNAFFLLRCGGCCCCFTPTSEHLYFFLLHNFHNAILLRGWDDFKWKVGKTHTHTRWIK